MKTKVVKICLCQQIQDVETIVRVFLVKNDPSYVLMFKKINRLEW